MSRDAQCPVARAHRALRARPSAAHQATSYGQAHTEFAEPEVTRIIRRGRTPPGNRKQPPFPNPTKNNSTNGAILAHYLAFSEAGGSGEAAGLRGASQDGVEEACALLREIAGRVPRLRPPVGPQDQMGAERRRFAVGVLRSCLGRGKRRVRRVLPDQHPKTGRFELGSRRLRRQQEADARFTGPLHGEVRRSARPGGDFLHLRRAHQRDRPRAAPEPRPPRVFAPRKSARACRRA
jgi:hypothetical protein